MKPKPNLTKIEPPAVRKLAAKLWKIGYMAKRRAIRETAKPLTWDDVSPGNRAGWYAVARHLLKLK